jgi:hypothetical protein
METRELPIPYDQTYNAAANTLFTLGFNVEQSNLQSGMIRGRAYNPRTLERIVNTTILEATLGAGAVGAVATPDESEAINFLLSEIEPEITYVRMQVYKNGRPIHDRKLVDEIWNTVASESGAQPQVSHRRPPRLGPAKQ